MLILKHRRSNDLHRSQQGIVLVIVLIVLVAMTMAGIALMRSVNTSTLVAGNLAFRQSTLASADIGVEQAIYWLQANPAQLNNSLTTAGYSANILGVPKTADGTAWNAYWNNTLDTTPVARPVLGAPVSSGAVWTLPTDSAGNTVSYVIHRLCNQDGDRNAPGGTVQCLASASSSGTDGDNKGVVGGGGVSGAGIGNKQIYYRITTRVEGPRNTVSYVQTTVSM
ncbi:MAG: hypothetical protein JSS58_11675 [Proteobacteria bacterium]|nr:hypothetical protein [Pseudomonadota bacterium]